MAVRTRVLMLAAALTLSVADGGTLAAQQSERHVLEGDHVAIYNLAGEVRVEPGSGSQTVVEVTRGGDDAEQLRVETGSQNGARTLQIVYPGDRIVYPRLGAGSRSQFRVGVDGIFGEGRRVTVTGAGNGLEAYADLRVLVPAGQRVAVYQGAGRIHAVNVDGTLHLDGAAASVEAEGTRGALTVDVGSGSVRVRDAQGDLDVDTGSGSVEVSGVRGSRVRVDTGSGGVSGSGIAASSLEVDVGSGRVRLSDLRVDDAIVDTGSGGVELSLVEPVRSLDVDTGSGGVTLTVPASLSADVEIDTGSGGISVDLPVRAERASRNYLRGRIGDGGDGRIRIETGSGSVRILGG